MVTTTSGLQAIALAAAPGAMAGDEVQSVWDFLVKGGPMMVPIVLASLVVLAVGVERLLVLRRSAIVPAALVREVADLLAGAGGERERVRRAIARAERDGSPLAQVAIGGLRRVGLPLDAIERGLADEAERQVHRMRTRTRALSIVASVAPMLGLVGTIFGMIKAFQTVASSAEALGRTEMLAGGIYEAMITTAAGLIVAIPALLFHHWIQARIERLVLEIDRGIGTMLEPVLGATAVTELAGGDAVAPVAAMGG